MRKIAKLLGYIYILTVLNTLEAGEVEQDLRKDWMSIYIEPFTVSLTSFDLDVCLCI